MRSIRSLALSILLAALFWLHAGLGASAQTQVISTCTSSAAGWVAGQTGRPMLQDQNGLLCVGQYATCPNTAVINVTAGATTQLVALAAGQSIYVCSAAISMSAAGTAQFVYGTGSNCGTGTTNITGAMTLATGTPLVIGSGAVPVFRGIAANAVCLTAATGNVTGILSYGQF